MPTPDFEFVGGSFLAEAEYIVELMFSPSGFQIWLEAVTGTSGDFLTVRLDDAVAVELTELTDVILGLTMCTVDDRATNRIVGTFLFDDLPELTQPVAVWEIDPSAGELVPVGGPVTCVNESFGV